MPDIYNVTLKMTERQYDAYSAAAARENMELREWITKAMSDRAIAPPHPAPPRPAPRHSLLNVNNKEV